MMTHEVTWGHRMTHEVTWGHMRSQDNYMASVAAQNEYSPYMVISGQSDLIHNHCIHRLFLSDNKHYTVFKQPLECVYIQNRDWNASWMRSLHHILLTSTPPWECRWPVDSQGEEADNVMCLPDWSPHCLTGCEMAYSPPTIFQTTPCHSSRHRWLWYTSCRAVPRKRENSQNRSCNFLSLLHDLLFLSFSFILPSLPLSTPLSPPLLSLLYAPFPYESSSFPLLSPFPPSSHLLSLSLSLFSLCST